MPMLARDFDVWIIARTNSGRILHEILVHIMICDSRSVYFLRCFFEGFSVGFHDDESVCLVERRV